MKRLQSRLIAAFLGIVVLTMLPLSVFNYYSIDSWFRDFRNTVIEEVRNGINNEYERTIRSMNSTFLLAVKAYNGYLEGDPSKVKEFKTSENANDFDEDILYFERIYLDKIQESALFLPGMKLEVVPLSKYQQIKEWSENNYKIEDEENKIVYYYTMIGIIVGDHASEMEVIGGLLISIPLIRKTDEQTDYQFLIGADQRLRGITRVIGRNPFLLKDVLSEEEYKSLYEDKNEIEIKSLSVSWMNNGEPSQAWLKPIVNQDGDLTSIIIVSARIFDTWALLGSSIIKYVLLVSVIMVIFAVIISRSISKPMYELVGAAKRMSQGDFSTRIAVKGTTEQQVLRNTFNQLSDRITQQLSQLQQQTNRLEISNRELEDTQRFLQNILVNIHTGVLSVDRNGKITLINQVCETVLHINDCEGKPFADVLQSNVLIKLIQYSLEQCIGIYQQELLYEPGYDYESIPLQVSTVPMLQQGEFTGLVVTIHDLSVLRKLEAEVRRHDRLVALGRMAGGLAHEIRNPLGIIRGSAEILNKRFGGMAGEEGLSQFIIEEVAGLSRVLSDFLVFARPPMPNMLPVEAQELMNRIIPYVQQSDKYELDCQIAPDTPLLHVDSELCKQAFLNLILNAQDAMPDGGTITIKIEPLRRQDVIIEVIDEGKGIPGELSDRIFDPFVTSKDHGTGLGLSLVHQIVSNQDGKIEVESDPGKGTCFRIIFPAYRESISTIEALKPEPV